MSTPSGSAIRVRTWWATDAPGGPAHDLVQQRPVGDRVVGHRRSRLPQRARRRQRLRDGLAAVQVQAAQAGAQGRVRQPGGVRRDHRERDPVLAAGGELRPVGRDSLLGVEDTALDEHRQHRGGDPLAAGRDHHRARPRASDAGSRRRSPPTGPPPCGRGGRRPRRPPPRPGQRQLRRKASATAPKPSATPGCAALDMGRTLAPGPPPGPSSAEFSGGHDLQQGGSPALQLARPHPGDAAQLVQRPRRRGGDLPEGGVVEDHVRGQPGLLGRGRPPGPEPLEQRLAGGVQRDRVGGPGLLRGPGPRGPRGLPAEARRCGPRAARPWSRRSARACRSRRRRRPAARVRAAAGPRPATPPRRGRSRSRRRSGWCGRAA